MATVSYNSHIKSSTMRTISMSKLFQRPLTTNTLRPFHTLTYKTISGTKNCDIFNHRLVYRSAVPNVETTANFLENIKFPNNLSFSSLLNKKISSEPVIEPYKFSPMPIKPSTEFIKNFLASSQASSPTNKREHDYWNNTLYSQTSFAKKTRSITSKQKQKQTSVNSVDFPLSLNSGRNKANKGSICLAINGNAFGSMCFRGNTSSPIGKTNSLKKYIKSCVKSARIGKKHWMILPTSLKSNLVISSPIILKSGYYSHNFMMEKTGNNSKPGRSRLLSALLKSK